MYTWCNVELVQPRNFDTVESCREHGMSAAYVISRLFDNENKKTSNQFKSYHIDHEKGLLLRKHMMSSYSYAP